MSTRTESPTTPGEKEDRTPGGGPPEGGRRRAAVENVRPEVDAGRFPVKRTAGDLLTVEADAFTDGHDRVRVRLLHRRGDGSTWQRVEMTPQGNDRWRASVRLEEPGEHRYTVVAWADPFRSWRADFAKRVAAWCDLPLADGPLPAVEVPEGGSDWAPGDPELLQELDAELRAGAEQVEAAAERAPGDDGVELRERAHELAGEGGLDLTDRIRVALGDPLRELADRYPADEHATRYRRELSVVVERERARFGAWYELFPRSTAAEEGRHGTFADVEDRLPYLEELGFDVLYLPPVHPIGRTHRKGPNNAPEAGPEEPGSPWAIGSEAGGHRSIHPALGTLEDFRRLVRSARERGIEVALDVAFQCSPDHPWVEEHPEWFGRRPDGAIRYAENPPKKYEDIYPLDFETDAWRELWLELRDVVLHWADQGVRIFRVDNPHTKPFRFWEWLIREVREAHPGTIFLSEAFTRPKVMYRLAKLGFSQSYTYFAWRNTKEELTSYLTELTRTDVAEFFRPNLWPNTPDILTEMLQTGGRPAFAQRLVLAATLGASYGIYGPAFELGVREPREPGSEEYLHSEKYEVRHWEPDAEASLADLVARVNRIRQENPALRRNRTLRFHGVEGDHLLAYSKRTPDGRNVVLVVVNLDPHHAHEGWTDLDLEELGVASGESFEVHDLLADERFLWSGSRNFVRLDPRQLPAHVFRVEGRARTERDHDYFL